jgi:hypothetical protein
MTSCPAMIRGSIAASPLGAPRWSCWLVARDKAGAKDKAALVGWATQESTALALALREIPDYGIYHGRRRAEAPIPTQKLGLDRRFCGRLRKIWLRRLNEYTFLASCIDHVYQKITERHLTAAIIEEHAVSKALPPSISGTAASLLRRHRSYIG